MEASGTDMRRFVRRAGKIRLMIRLCLTMTGRSKKSWQVRKDGFCAPAADFGSRLQIRVPLETDGTDGAVKR
jgi:hypothetical protein